MSDSIETTKSISGVAELLGKVAGLLFGLSALAYFVGYRIETHYLSEAGAGWAIGLLSPAELIQAGQGVIVTVGITFFISVMALMDGDTTAEKLRRKDILFSVAAMILLAVAYATSKYWGNHRLDYTLSLIAGIVWASGAGFTIGELVASYGEAGHRWKGYHVKLIWFFYISALAAAPYFIGANKAKLDLEPEMTSLPIAVVSGEAPGTWRVMRVVGDKYLLVSLSQYPALRKFRFTELTSGVSVSSVKISHK